MILNIPKLLHMSPCNNGYIFKNQNLHDIYNIPRISENTSTEFLSVHIRSIHFDNKSTQFNKNKILQCLNH